MSRIIEIPECGIYDSLEPRSFVMPLDGKDDVVIVFPNGKNLGYQMERVREWLDFLIDYMDLRPPGPEWTEHTSHWLLKLAKQKDTNIVRTHKGIHQTDIQGTTDDTERAAPGR